MGLSWFSVSAVTSWLALFTPRIHDATRSDWKWCFMERFWTSTRWESWRWFVWTTCVCWLMLRCKLWSIPSGAGFLWMRSCGSFFRLLRCCQSAAGCLVWVTLLMSCVLVYSCLWEVTLFYSIIPTSDLLFKCFIDLLYYMFEVLLFLLCYGNNKKQKLMH